MKPFVCLQAGHQNITSNCEVSLRGGTGAPGEVEFTVRVRDRLSQILQTKGFAVQLVDANYNCDARAGTHDFDLFLAIHYDADIYGKGGGCVSAADPSVDQANQKSRAIAVALAHEYFPYTGIENHPERINGNMTFYYMWQTLSAKTPCVLLECGTGQDAHDKVILADTNRVATGIARGLCLAFGMPYDGPNPPPVPSTPDQYKKALQAIRSVIVGTGQPYIKVNKIKDIVNSINLG